MKNILILGASGRTGKFMLEAALEKGYNVTALVRNLDSISINDKKLNLIKGTPYNLEDINKVMSGNEAVVVVLNNPRKSDSLFAKPLGEKDIIAKSVSNCIKAMKVNNIKRIVVMSSYGVGDSFEMNHWLTRFLIRYSNLKTAFNDHQVTEKLLRESDLLWTTVKPVMLTESEIVKPVQVSYTERLSMKSKISRKQVANFMLDTIDKPEYYLKTPHISEK